VCFDKLGRVCVLLGVFGFLAGCGGGASDAPAVVPVKGVVNYQGKPVPNVAVSFIPEKGLLATGTTDADGKFELTTNKPGDGAVVGTYKVAINFSPELPEEAMGDPNYKAPTSPIPTKYADVSTSGLTQTVDKDASKNNFTFDLTD
jgi:hypothetical protein